MSTGPGEKSPALRAFAFFDGQNLFNAAKRAFGYREVNYDPLALANHVCGRWGWQLIKVHFYTGIPSDKHGRYRREFWNQKIRSMIRQGIGCWPRELRYGSKEFTLADETTIVRDVAEEKGVDVSIAVDLIKYAADNSYDVCIIFSQDNDLDPAIKYVKSIAKSQRRFIKVASAFPVNPAIGDRQGIWDTDWIEIHRVDYDTCLDTHDYDPAIRKVLDQKWRSGQHRR